MVDGWLTLDCLDPSVFERRRRLHQQDLIAEQRKRIENRMERSILAEIASSIGHEINQPVAAIESLSDTASMLIKNGDQEGATYTSGYNQRH